MKLNILDISDNSWLEILNRLPHDVYHLPEYVALEAQRTNTIPQAFILEDGDCLFFIPYLLRSCADIARSQNLDIYDVFSPYGYPGILMNEVAIQNPEFLESALAKFSSTLQKNNVCSAFLRLHPILGSEFTDSLKSQYFRPNGQTISIDLTLDENRIWAKTRRGHQSTINKCIRLGFTAKTVPLLEHLDKFIDIYLETMERVNAQDRYYFSRQYFESLLELNEKIHLGVVESEGQIICACLFFESCNIVQAHLGGTKTAFLKQSPFNLLLHHMALWGKARGNKYLHIGGGLGGKKDNLYTFKSGFSKQRHDFFTFRSIVDRLQYNDLLEYRAKFLNKPIEELKRSQFFPAYRAT